MTSAMEKVGRIRPDSVYPSLLSREDFGMSLFSKFTDALTSSGIDSFDNN